jgi:hypothetical protein
MVFRSPLFGAASVRSYLTGLDIQRLYSLDRVFLPKIITANLVAHCFR